MDSASATRANDTADPVGPLRHLDHRCLLSSALGDLQGLHQLVQALDYEGWWRALVSLRAPRQEHTTSIFAPRSERRQSQPDGNVSAGHP
jgi:hypothetical protein